VTDVTSNPSCRYCDERLAVNVGLIAENRQLREAIKADPEKFSFETFMVVADVMLAEVYPETIFIYDERDRDREPGSFLVAALRRCREAMSEPTEEKETDPDD
jgi:hypothetical protein